MIVHVTNKPRVESRSSIVAIGKIANQLIKTNGTMATSDQKIADRIPITTADFVGITRKATIGPTVKGNAIGIHSESSRDSASELAHNSVNKSRVAVEN
ncbi:hypothetical protein GCM10023156_28200 [Novipirellula rosea]|uniref:Uncharacterized protein n=1 Tax=Novipirellula rosea TaxID=1031540 RepID=A0ABP8MRY1_9BACT